MLCHWRKTRNSILPGIYFLFPDIFNYFLTGKKATEFSFATTSQLYNIRTDSWEKKIFAQLGVSINIMQKVVRHGTVIGMVEPEIRKDNRPQ